MIPDVVLRFIADETARALDVPRHAPVLRHAVDDDAGLRPSSRICEKRPFDHGREVPVREPHVAEPREIALRIRTGARLLTGQARRVDGLRPVLARLAPADPD